MAFSGFLLNRCISAAAFISKPGLSLHRWQSSFQTSHIPPRSLFLSHPNAAAPTPIATASSGSLIHATNSREPSFGLHLLPQQRASSTATTLPNSAVAPHKLPLGLKRWAKELAKGVWGYWKGGRWKPLAISARHVARLRKQTLLAGGEWPYDRPRKQMKVKMKGHKVDRLAIEKRKRTTELMEKMPQMLLDLKKRRWERKYKK